MTSNTPFPEFKTTGDEKHDLETFIVDLIDHYTENAELVRCIKRKRIKLIKLWHTLSLSPAARTVYKCSLALREADLKKSHSVAREYCGASIGVSGERQKYLRLLQQENK